MYRDELQDNEDLRVEIFRLKKQFSNTSAENHLLKVKIRKLQNELVRKDREMDVFLDPRKSNDIRKILYERSASFVLNMKEKNDELLHLLHEKDVIIRRLQNQVEMTKLYSQAPKKQYHCKCSDRTELGNRIRQIQMKSYKSGSFEGGNKSKKNRSLSWTAGLQEAESTLMEDVVIDEEEEEEEEEKGCGKNDKTHSSYDVKDQYKNLSREHLLSIIENLKNNQRYSPSSRQTSSRKSSPESDLERIELLCESPHEEIQQLHMYFLDMITEVDHLKNTIARLQNNQEKTENVLKKKNTNIDKLAQEIKNLKRPKTRPKSSRNRVRYSSAEEAARLYASNNDHWSKVCPKYEKERERKAEKKTRKSDQSSDSENNKKQKQKMKDAIVQVDKINSPGSVAECVYVEKGSITITEKSKNENKNDKEYEYEDEIFEECDKESVAVN